MRLKFWFSKQDLFLFNSLIKDETKKINIINLNHIKNTFTENNIQKNNMELNRIWNYLHKAINNKNTQILPAFTVAVLTKPFDITNCLNFIFYTNNGQKIYLNQIQNNNICQEFCNETVTIVMRLIKQSKLKYNLTSDVKQKIIESFIKDNLNIKNIKYILELNYVSKKHPLFKLLNEIDIENKKYINYCEIFNTIQNLFYTDSMLYETDLQNINEDKNEMLKNINNYELDRRINITVKQQELQQNINKTLDEGTNLIKKINDVLIEWFFINKLFRNAII